MSKNTGFEIRRVEKAPEVGGLMLTNACADDDSGVETFMETLSSDLRRFGSRIPSGVDPEVLVVVMPEGNSRRISVHVSCTGTGDLKFWNLLRLDGCRALASEWFAKKWNSRKGG